MNMSDSGWFKKFLGENPSAKLLRERLEEATALLAAKDEALAQQERRLTDATALAEAGAFAIVLEGMAEPLAARITAEIAIPTIGIGASAACDGQVLVMEDMLGLNPTPPKFVREYASLGPAIEAAVKAYAADVRARTFPGTENVYPMKKAQ